MVELITAACMYNKGLRREKNEDNFLFFGKSTSAEQGSPIEPFTSRFSVGETACIGVFDGMGGEQYGEVASFIAAQTLREYWDKKNNGSQKVFQDVDEVISFLNGVLLETNRRVCQERIKLKCRRMGSTAVILLYWNRLVFICNLGDSRAYEWRNGTLKQVSVDHTDVVLTANSVRKPALMQFLGIDEEEMLLEPSITCMDYCSNAQYLLCSDGLTDMVEESRISEILGSVGDAGKCVDSLIAEALEKGGKDNVTTILVSGDDYSSVKDTFLYYFNRRNN